MITQEGRQRGVSVSEQILKKIKGEFPDLKPYLVFSSINGQAFVGSSLPEILTEYPAMCMDTPELGKAKALVRAMEKLRNPNASPDPGKERTQLERQLTSLEHAIVFNDDVQVELRFAVLKYEQIFALQQHPLVDRDLTPQTHASIRIVLGTLKRLSERADG
jgi:hypothetical protein